MLAARVPESWIPPAHVSEARTRIRLYKALVDERSGWLQRTHAVLFHHGAPAAPGLARAQARARLDLSALPPAAQVVVEVALRSVDRINDEPSLALVGGKRFVTFDRWNASYSSYDVALRVGSGTP